MTGLGVLFYVTDPKPTGCNFVSIIILKKKASC